MDGLDKGRLLSLICDRTGLKGKDIGKIDLKGAYSFFEVEKSLTASAREHLHGFEYKGRMVRVEITGPEEDRESRKERKPEGRRFAHKEGDRKPGNRSFGERRFGEKKFGDKKFGEKKFGDKKFTGNKFGGSKFNDKKFEEKKSKPKSSGDDWFESKMKDW